MSQGHVSRVMVIEDVYIGTNVKCAADTVVWNRSVEASSIAACNGLFCDIIVQFPEMP